MNQLGFQQWNGKQHNFGLPQSKFAVNGQFDAVIGKKHHPPTIYLFFKQVNMGEADATL